MDVVRLIITLILLGGLVLVLIQNLTPAVPLVFLGMRSQPLPLALLVLSSTAAGALTSVLMNNLVKLATLAVIRSPTTPSTRPQSKTNSRAEPPPRRNTESPRSPSEPDQVDDWQTNRNLDDWSSTTQSQTKSSFASNSEYSYGYQNPENTSVGKTESVYDADYRVIIPPYTPPPETSVKSDDDDDDDWGFFADAEEE